MKSIRSWFLPAVVAVCAAAVFSVWLESRQAARASMRYLGIWETEIARSLLENRRTDEVEKLLAQIEEFHPSLSVARPDRRCEWPVRRSVSLYAVPATEVVVCREGAVLVRQGLLSPVFFGLLLALGAIALWAVRREHVQELLRLATEARAEADAEIARQSRKVAHDIRGPLSALRILAERSRSIEGDERSLLTGAVDRIHGIAEDLLRRSRKAEAAAPAGADLDGAVRALESELAARFAGRTIEFSLQSNATVPMAAPELQRHLSNLVQNAAEAGPSPILIATRLAAGAVTLTVADQGKGIPESLLPRLGREEVTGKAGGNGLGLRELFRAVEAAGGSVEIRSRENVGTQVEIRFPPVTPR